MKINIAIVIVLIGVFGVLTIGQIQKVQAFSNPGYSIITNPLTSPISYFTISGKVGYRFFGIFSPAENVTVKAVNTYTKTVYKVLTNKRGKYSILVKAGIYNVSAKDATGTIFYPTKIKVNVTTSNATNINFISESSPSGDLNVSINTP